MLSTLSILHICCTYILSSSFIYSLFYVYHRPLSRRLDRCDRVIQNESRDPFGGNVYYVTMQSTFLTRKFRNGERNLHCDVVHITTKWVSSLTLDCNGVFAIKAYYSTSLSSYVPSSTVLISHFKGPCHGCLELFLQALCFISSALFDNHSSSSLTRFLHI